MHDMRERLFFLLVCYEFTRAAERLDLGAGFGVLCSELYFCGGPLAGRWGRMQQCHAPSREFFSGLANTGKFTGIIIPV